MPISVAANYRIVAQRYDAVMPDELEQLGCFVLMPPLLMQLEQ